MKESNLSKRNSYLDDVEEGLSDAILALENGKELTSEELLRVLKSAKRVVSPSKRQPIIDRYMQESELKSLTSVVGYFNSVNIKHHEISSRFMSMSRSLSSENLFINKDSFVVNCLKKDLGVLNEMLINLADLNYESLNHDPPRNLKTLVDGRRRVNLIKDDESRLVTTKPICYILDELLNNAMFHSEEKIDLVHVPSRNGWEVVSWGEPLLHDFDDLCKAGLTTDFRKSGMGLYYAKFI